MSDIAVSQTNQTTQTVQAIKPSYLVELSEVGSKKNSFFLTIESPTYESNYVKAKGLYIKDQEKFTEELANLDKSKVMEIIFPWHRVQQIRNLSFKTK